MVKSKVELEHDRLESYIKVGLKFYTLTKSLLHGYTKLNHVEMTCILISMIAIPTLANIICKNAGKPKHNYCPL